MAVLVFALLSRQLNADQGETFSFNPAEFDAAVAKMREDAGAPGMAVAVLHNGQTLHAKGYGIAGPDDKPVTTQTAFQIGSITKSFVAIVILQMASESKLNLDDPVVQHISTFHTTDKSQSDQITIDQLITHHSGLSTLHGNSISNEKSGLSGPAAAVAGLASVKLFANPGTTFQYSNANYALLSHLIETLEEQPFEQILKTRIFDPLGMTNSYVQIPPSSDLVVATAYRLWFGVPVPRRPMPNQKPDRSMIGAGGVSASIEDLARYVEAVRTRDPRIVPVNANRLFDIKPFYEQWGYAYGWYSDTSGDEPIFEHSGFTPGFFTLATMMGGQTVVVLTNMSGLAHGDLPRAVTNTALGWEPVAAAAPFSAKIAIWSAVTAPLGLLLLLYKTAQRLLVRHPQVNAGERLLNFVAALGLLAAVYIVYLGFQSMLGVSFATGFAFYPDLTGTAVAAMAIALLIAAGRLLLAVRTQ